jgi:YegS/Rv2252/BmrU family lipid kinase
MKKIRFIINPISGVGKKNQLPRLIEENLNKERFSYEIAHTQFRGHAYEIAVNAIAEEIDILVIVGGDGSISETASALIGSEVTLGIIPCGSGNGIARHFNIPLSIKKAIALINSQSTHRIDTGEINDRSFTGFCGFGYDAFIAHRFDKLNKRGFWSYAKLVLKELKNFEPIHVECLKTGKVWDNIFFCSVANTSQFGSNFRMSPGSVPNDGKLELILVQKTNFFQFIGLLYKSYFGDVRTSKHTITISEKDFHFQVSTALAHIDGDPYHLTDNNVKIKCISKSLNIIANV